MNNYNQNYLNNLFYENSDETIYRPIQHFGAPITSNGYSVVATQEHPSHQWIQQPSYASNQNPLQSQIVLQPCTNTLSTLMIPSVEINHQLSETHSRNLPIIENVPTNDFNRGNLVKTHENLETAVVPSSLRKQIAQFSCTEQRCDKSYTTISGLNNHIKKKHSGPLHYPCDECSASFMATHERTMHKIKEHDGRRYQTARHRKINLVKTLKCTVHKSAKEFRKPAGLDKHVTIHNKEYVENAHKCTTCPEVFSNKTDLACHMRIKHTENNQYPCLECHKIFLTFDTFKEHQCVYNDNIFTQTTKISESHKTYMSKPNQKQLTTNHEDKTTFKCVTCSQFFRSNQILQQHIITCKLNTIPPVGHTTDKYECLKCPKVFSTEISLSNHEKRHSLRMNYTCQICKEVLSTRAKFQKHIKDHLERNLKCSVCNKEFQSLVKYGYHKAEMHSIMKPYDCVLCSEQFCTRHELFMHLHNHNDTVSSCNLYKCDQCERTLSSKDAYEQHITVHSKLSPSLELSIESLADDNTYDECNPIYPTQIPLHHNETKNNYTSSMNIFDEVFNTSIEQTENKSINPIFTEIQKPSDSEKLYNTNENLIEQQIIQPKQTEILNITDKFTCEKCPKTFNYQSLLNYHKTNEHELKTYPCLINFCDQVYSTEKELEKHKNNQHHNTSTPDPNDIQCKFDGCTMAFPSQHLLKKHMQIHRLKIYECEKCHKKYYSEGVIRTHMRLCMPANDDVLLVADEDIDSGPVICKICNQLFENKKVLKFHRKFCFDETDGHNVKNENIDFNTDVCIKEEAEEEL